MQGSRCRLVVGVPVKHLRQESHTAPSEYHMCILFIQPEVSVNAPAPTHQEFPETIMEKHDRLVMSRWNVHYGVEIC